MISMKKRFENKAKIRINLMGSHNSRKSSLIFNLGKKGVFMNHNSIQNNVFSTEVLYSSPNSNVVKVYFDFEKKDEVLSNVRYTILHLIDEAFMDELKKIEADGSKIQFYQSVIQAIKNKSYINFSSIDSYINMEEIFKKIDFNRLFDDLSNIKIGDNIEEKDELIWKSYFSGFEQYISSIYDEFMNEISKYYIHCEEGCIYDNEGKDDTCFFNENFMSLEKILYEERNICAFMIRRMYIEVPAVRDEYWNSVFIDFNSRNLNHNTAYDIADIVSEDYKSLFIIISNADNAENYLSSINNSVNRITIEKRVFCILDIDNMENLNSDNQKNNYIKDLKNKASALLNIKENRVIVTHKLMDIDKDSFLNLYKQIKRQAVRLAPQIKIKHSYPKNIINISLNQDRMSVQSLMSMLYDRYNGYLVDLWRGIIKQESSNYNRNKKYYYNCVKNVIRNRKDDFKSFRCEKKGFINYNRDIDFSITHGDYNDSKRIVEMLVDYGYHTVGFNSRENKILVSVNGEISKEDRENLIKLIKGRLEESALKYFEDAFLVDMGKKKFKLNSLKNCLEVEQSVTIDDFYNAFEKVFKKMCENIERYELCLVD
ncbi:MAG: hypothetical protein ACI398_05970 [Clostridium sp.]